MARIEPYQHVASNKMQFQLVVRRFAPFAEFGAIHGVLPFGIGSFKGDNRTFSTSAQVTYKTALFLVLDLSKGKIVEGPVGHSTGTIRHKGDAKTFARVGFKIKYLKAEAGRISLYVSFHGANPGAEGLWGRVVGLASPDIDTDLLFNASLKDGNLVVGGRLFGDGFPDAELFLRDNGQTAHMLATYRTPYHKDFGPAIRLPRPGKKHLGTFKEGLILNEQCRFAGTTGA
jgi:hypothetical protein